jgi:RimJ/RimL family protein N-acetyltransferase/predicted thioesterase
MNKGESFMDNYKTMLETERLTLRPPMPDDFEAFHSWCSDSENTRYMSFGPNDEEQTKAWLAGAKPGRDFAVVLKDTNAVIGSCGIYPKETGYMGELGWILHKDYWKRGYGTELAGELIRYGFEDLKLGRIQAPCAAVNYGSYRVMERNGMRREALHRKAFWARVDKDWVDELWYAILSEDYFSERSPLIGKTASVSTTVTEANTAKTVGSGSLDVFATPMMITLMEKAACECLADTLTDGQTSVGAQIEIEHTSASPLGAKITATATIDFVSGRKIEFTVTANDSAGEIGKGKHTRFIVDEERFMAKARAKK